MSVPTAAVVGAGHMGRFHAQKLAELSAEGLVRLVGIHDSDPARAAELAQTHGVAVFEKVADVAREAEAAVVAVPTSVHEAITLPLLRAGVDLLVEKPIAADRTAARNIVDTARENGCVLQVGHVERFNAAFRKILPVLARPRFIEAHRIGPYPKRGTDVSVVLDLMIHDLDLVAMLVGTEVETVQAFGVPVLSATEDIANARVDFASGCTLNVTASRVSMEPMRKIRLFQLDSYISLDFGANEIVVVRREGEPGSDPPPTLHVEKLDLDPQDALLAQDRAFVDAVVARSTPEVSGEDGLRALELALRIQDAIVPDKAGV